MSMSPSEILDLVAPEYAAHVAKAEFLAMAEERTSTSFGLKRPYAVAFRAAHDMTMIFSGIFAGGTGGEVASKKEGDLQISYFKASSSSDMELGFTTYGKRLLALTRGNILLVGVTGASNI